MEAKKVILGLFTILVVGSITFIMQGCNSDDESTVRDITVASIAESDEFIDFSTSCNLLTKKFLTYTETLSQAEFDELMDNLDNEKYMSDIMNKADVGTEIQEVENYRNKLFYNPNYLKLEVSDQINLFVNFAKGTERIAIKTRSAEGEGLNECEKRRLEDYAWAQGIADVGLIGCTCMIEIPIVACVCYTTVMLNYANDIRLAERAYEDCMKSIR